MPSIPRCVCMRMCLSLVRYVMPGDVHIDTDVSSKYSGRSDCIIHDNVVVVVYQCFRAPGRETNPCPTRTRFNCLEGRSAYQSSTFALLGQVLIRWKDWPPIPCFSQQVPVSSGERLRACINTSCFILLSGWGRMQIYYLPLESESIDKDHLFISCTLVL